MTVSPQQSPRETANAVSTNAEVKTATSVQEESVIQKRFPLPDLQIAIPPVNNGAATARSSTPVAASSPIRLSTPARTLPVMMHPRSESAREILEETNDNESHEPNIFLNIYDISKANGCLWFFRAGIFHCGIEIFENEYSYGGHPDDTTGVVCAKPGSVSGAKFRSKMPLGYTNLEPIEVQAEIIILSKEWSGNQYDPFRRNCNHFCDRLARHLTGQGIPKYINRITKMEKLVRCCIPLVQRSNIRPITYGDDIPEIALTKQEQKQHMEAVMNRVLIDAALSQKQKGNTFFIKGSFEAAVQCYTKALSYLQQHSSPDRRDQSLHGLFPSLYVNLAACGLKLKQYQQTVDYCTQALKYDEMNAKAHFRRGVAHMSLGALEQARTDLVRAKQLSPSDLSILNELHNLYEKEKEIKDKEAKAFSRMFTPASPAAAVGKVPLQTCAVVEVSKFSLHAAAVERPPAFPRQTTPKHLNSNQSVEL
eukprot:GILJ01009259.1.p1 GENE.GILJ01009259.1~~GILJ01009259.1.p1  ORF type:complete len:480 (+),score=44.07 GILJ01009259.1:58-1497(+)